MDLLEFLEQSGVRFRERLLNDDITPAPAAQSEPSSAGPSADTGPSTSEVQASSSDGRSKCPNCKAMIRDMENHNLKCTLLRCNETNCKFATYIRNQMKRHLETHKERSARRYVCSACYRRFVQNAHLKAHWKICDRRNLERIRKEYTERFRNEDRLREEKKKKDKERRKARRTQDGTSK
eukprot:gb/GEZJ01005590.1/.p1 GENE.gb/GEZJ01005590.1/~~gb/GEZJ01005590.1/.p1  ORF type:complete len:180 (-),score=18.89 gb/GEZJ01005590.1/:1340-1879(-)